MKILLITDNYTPSGGAENYFFTLKSHLEKIPDLKTYTLGFGPETQQKKDSLIIKSLQSNVAKLLGRILFQPLLYLKLRRFLKQIQPDVIHLHNVKQYPATLLPALKGFNVVQTVHDFSYICPTGQNLHKNLTPCATGLSLKCFWQHRVKFGRFAYLAICYSFYKIRSQLNKRVHTFIAPSPLLADYLNRNCFPKVAYIPHFKSHSTSSNFERMDTHKFLYAGSLAAHKGIHLLIEEFALACRKNRALSLYIAGIGPLEKDLRERVRELKIEENVYFIGWQENLYELYTSCCALIFPSIGLESFGLVITESMSHARAVIGVNRGTTAWLVEDEKTGLLFDPLKSGDLAAKILRLAGDKPFAMTLGKQGQERLDGLIDNEKVLQEILMVYRNAHVAV